MIAQIQKFRHLFLSIYKEDQSEALLKIGFVTDFIKNKFQQVSFLFGLSFYARIEQLFVRFQNDEIQDILNYFKQILSLQMIPEEQKQIETVCQWLQKMISFLEKQQMENFENYIQFYNQVFYQDVFEEYANRKDQTLVEESLSFASSLYIQKWAVGMENINNEIVKEGLKYLQSDLEEYLKLNDEMKIYYLAEVYSLSIRFFLDLQDEVQVYNKKKSSITQDYERNNDLSLNLIYNPTTDSFRICYEENYKGQYQQYQYYYKYNRYLNKEIKNCQDIINCVKEKSINEINERLKDLQNEIYKYESQIEERKKEIEDGISQYNNYQVLEKQLEQEIQQLKQNREQLNMMLIQQQYKDEAALKQQMEREKIEQQQRKARLAYELDCQQRQIKGQNLNQYYISNYDINTSLRQPQMQANYEYDDCLATTNIVKKFYCEVCTVTYELNKQIYFSCCGKKYCKDCVIRHFESTQIIQDKRKLVCFCGQELENINQFLDLQIITEKVMKIFQLELKQCVSSKCNYKFYVKNKNAATVTCPACKTVHCTGCFKESHSKDSLLCGEQIKNFETAIDLHINYIQQQIDQQNAQPNANDQQVQNRIVELEKEKRFRICPYCYNLLLKDDHCEHIKCPECKKDLCFTCACLRIPTMAHDNQFHRRECSYADKRNLANIKFEQKCEECVRNQKVCEVPSDFQDYCQDVVIAKLGQQFFDRYPQNWQIQQF
ncbi:Ibr domain protein (macronuclear) [Tetrahymena thermophila SB210]|uniref:Ibr domain protein n=1 Tax=Tetrahymena thermophila (strain SB210) TaxID=312017 RepID=W7X4I4_TETTS|nr:Ibr domain protein [Tetrahymena thermophila SB210]EWS72317.1 Ibr domain protein [Tetrahymena thermophila SB210]|eukprot:XP_012655151.1 Ibr domain protein [Tetrahymena thermophila SB210]